MNIRDLTKLIDMVEEKYGDYVHAELYGDGSGAFVANDDAELITWDEENDMEKNIKLWLKD